MASALPLKYDPFWISPFLPQTSSSPHLRVASDAFLELSASTDHRWPSSSNYVESSHESNSGPNSPSQYSHRYTHSQTGTRSSLKSYLKTPPTRPSDSWSSLKPSARPCPGRWRTPCPRPLRTWCPLKASAWWPSLFRTWSPRSCPAPGWWTLGSRFHALLVNSWRGEARGSCPGGWLCSGRASKLHLRWPRLLRWRFGVLGGIPPCTFEVCFECALVRCSLFYKQP